MESSSTENEVRAGRGRTKWSKPATTIVEDRRGVRPTDSLIVDRRGGGSRSPSAEEVETTRAAVEVRGFVLTPCGRAHEMDSSIRASLSAANSAFGKAVIGGLSTTSNV
eukprot:6189585-Pleurochrysis_carterae.AAC.2